MHTYIDTCVNLNAPNIPTALYIHTLRVVCNHKGKENKYKTKYHDVKERRGAPMCIVSPI